MQRTSERIDAEMLIRQLEAKRLVHVYSRDLLGILPIIGQVAAWFANTRDVAPVTDRSHWRGIVVADPFRLGTQAVGYAKNAISAPGFSRWDNAVRGRQGHLRAVVADPLSLQGTIGWNLFFIVLRNQDQKVWNSLWASVVSDTMVLAVNSETFGQWKDFAHIDGGGEHGHYAL